jgi:hypothetical protein
MPVRNLTARVVAPAAVIAARPHSNEKRIIVRSGLLAMPEWLRGRARGAQRLVHAQEPAAGHLFKLNIAI